jgi:rubrerythrin
MKAYICEICGDAYIGEEKPSECPFCGSRKAFIKNGNEANPITIQSIELAEVSRKNLETTLELEMKANAIYLCMAGKAGSYEVKAMYKRLAKVELEHASVACKLMGCDLPQQLSETCSDRDTENFVKTVQLEEDATNIYVQFAKECEEKNLKIFFTALSQVEADHIKLIKNYL